MALRGDRPAATMQFSRQRSLDRVGGGSSLVWTACGSARCCCWRSLRAPAVDRMSEPLAGIDIAMLSTSQSMGADDLGRIAWPRPSW
jgi:hypothetical protein